MSGMLMWSKEVKYRASTRTLHNYRKQWTRQEYRKASSLQHHTASSYIPFQGTGAGSTFLAPGRGVWMDERWNQAPRLSSC